MDFKVISFPEVKSGQLDDIVLDPYTQQFILANPLDFMNSLPKNELSIIDQQTKELPSLENDKLSHGNKIPLSIPINASSLRFIPSHADKNMAISSTGYIITSLSFGEQTAITNFGYTHGSPYWEIICPNRCFGIAVGVVKDKWNIPENKMNKNKYELFEFNTSTSRTIGINLDFGKNEIKVYFGGKLQETQIRKLENGTWYPCVKIKDKGNYVVFNPFATHYTQTSNYIYVNNYYLL